MASSLERRDFNHILTKYGHICFLQRRCRVSSPEGAYDKHPESCSGCHGHGYLQTMERHICRKDTISSVYPNASSLIKAEFGLLLTDGVYFFLKHDVNPSEGDRILEWMDDLNRYRVYRIEKSIEMRGASGQIIYWIAACKIEET